LEEKAMKENHKSRKNDVIRFSDRSLTNENLKLIGFGCNISECEWSLSSSKYLYFKALSEHGKHNLEKHINNSKARITFKYIHK